MGLTLKSSLTVPLQLLWNQTPQPVLQVIAIVMDMITDLQILQDLMDAASRRSVPVYILLDHQGVPHFLDMCSRLQIGSQHLRVRRHFYPVWCGWLRWLPVHGLTVTLCGCRTSEPDRSVESASACPSGDCLVHCVINTCWWTATKSCLARTGEVWVCARFSLFIQHSFNVPLLVKRTCVCISCVINSALSTQPFRNFIKLKLLYVTFEHFWLWWLFGNSFKAPIFTKSNFLVQTKPNAVGIQTFFTHSGF